MRALAEAIARGGRVEALLGRPRAAPERVWLPQGASWRRWRARACPWIVDALEAAPAGQAERLAPAAHRRCCERSSGATTLLVGPIRFRLLWKNGAAATPSRARSRSTNARGVIELPHLCGVPDGIRTRVLALKGPRPGPLDDGDSDGRCVALAGNLAIVAQPTSRGQLTTRQSATGPPLSLPHGAASPRISHHGRSGRFRAYSVCAANPATPTRGHHDVRTDRKDDGGAGQRDALAAVLLEGTGRCPAV